MTVIARSTAQARGPFHALVKPIGALCNIDCEYCFYLKKSSLYPGSKFRMTDAVLETHVRQYIDAQPADCPEVNFAWQGGEPTLLGLDFFKRAVELQQRYARPGMKITNAFQTNGIRLDDAWCRFFRENDFLVGISIDGPEKLHNRYRRTKGGKDTFRLVKRGLEALQAAGAEYNVLTVVQRGNGARPEEVYRGLEALGAQYIQFIPIVEPEAGGVSERSVKPEQFGRFLCKVFDLWLEGDIGRVFVQHFDTALNALTGNPWTLCVHAPRCGRAVAIEHNGDVYSCDHFVFKDYLLGNIREHAWAELIDGPRQTAFGDAKELRLAPKCLRCTVRHMCHGGCPAHRLVPEREGEFALNYLCDGYYRFFAHIEPWLLGMRRALEERVPAYEYFRFVEPRLRPDRNSPCPCGSGRKFKSCCARLLPGTN